MSEQYSAEDSLKFLPVEEMAPKQTKRWPKKKFWPYQLGLVVNDIFWVFLSLWLLNSIIGLPFPEVNTLVTFSSATTICLIILSFVPTFQLYSYHFIFSKKKHRSGFIKAFAWSLAVLTIILGQYVLPVIWTIFPKATLALLGVGGVGLFGLGYRFNQSLHLLFKALGVSLIAIWFFDQLYFEKTFFRNNMAWTLPSVWFMSVCMVWFSRNFIINTVYSIWMKRSYRRQVAIIGSNDEAKFITSHIINHNAPFWVAGTIGKKHLLEASVPKDCLGDIVELPAIARENRISDFIVTDENIDHRTLISLLDFCLSKGISVWFSPKILPIIDRKIYINNFCGIPMIRMCSQKRIVLFNRIKYGFDACLTLPLFIMLLPLFGLISLAIKINSKGPVFYKARAIGKNGREFKMFKFRSMRVDNDASIHKDFVTKLIKGEIDQEEGQPLKITDDPRVTKVGKILRKTSLDEIPQLINVLMGQMSLIGPRPCLPYEFDVYQDWYKKRAAIRPGITGLWQVAGRSEVSFEEMILLDLYYLYNRSLWMDINLFIETVFVVLTKKGAY